MSRPFVNIILFASIFFVLHSIREFFKPYGSVSRGVHEAALVVEKWGGLAVVNMLTAIMGMVSLSYIAGSFVVGALSRPLMYTAASLKLFELFDVYLCLTGYRQYGRIDFYHGRIQRLISIALAAWVTVQIMSHVGYRR
ncbi:MAG: hypothetical protein GF344_18510 [Chitinivibrionales bacterium]|nr:hypothetical protein [Chitinivibrionales bacterium]MBD3358641.1 hypothetical protein [Chitinivibrionales bacterium]